MESSQPRWCTAPAVVKACSTPCGINGILTMQAAVRGCPMQRCSTPCGINGILTTDARRLVVLPRISAQRLAASMESSPVSSVGIASGSDQVLNALRHQWNPHRDTAAYAIRPVHVLNALRHQWNPHLITWPSWRSQRQRVLNALRHQWNPHPSCPAPDRPVIQGAQRLAASMESSPGHRVLSAG